MGSDVLAPNEVTTCATHAKATLETEMETLFTSRWLLEPLYFGMIIIGLLAPGLG